VVVRVLPAQAVMAVPVKHAPREPQVWQAFAKVATPTQVLVVTEPVLLVAMAEFLQADSLAVVAVPA
jgi:hypothetical protein